MQTPISATVTREKKRPKDFDIISEHTTVAFDPANHGWRSSSITMAQLFQKTPTKGENVCGIAENHVIEIQWVVRAVSTRRKQLTTALRFCFFLPLRSDFSC